jgi:hypothetical protein
MNDKYCSTKYGNIITDKWTNIYFYLSQILTFAPYLLSCKHSDKVSGRSRCPAD